MDSDNANGVQKREIQEMTDQGRMTNEDRFLAKGRAKGRAEGEHRGQLRDLRDILREILPVLLEERFGPLPTELRERIEATDHLECLRRAILQVGRLQKLEDLSL